MTGKATRIEYTDDVGTGFAVKTPDWQNTIGGNAAATATSQKPSGLITRYRMIMDPTTGREHKVRVGSVGAAAWTAALGAPAGNVVVADGSTITGALYGGRIGERRLIR